MIKTAWLLLIGVMMLAGAAFSEEPEIGGFVQAQYRDEVCEYPRFLVRAARIQLDADLTDRISIMGQFDAADDPVILDALIRYGVSERAQFSLGQFKVPFGFETRITRFELEAIERSLVVSHLLNNGFSSPYLRDLGLMVTGKVMAFNYDMAVVNGTGYNYTDDSASTSSFLKWGHDNNSTKDIVGRIGMGVPMFAGLGFSFYSGEWAESDDRDAWGFDIHFDTGKVILQYEYIRGRGRLVDGEWMSDKFSGYYLVAGYRIKPFLEPAFKLDKLDPAWDTGGDKLTDLHYGLNLNFERTARFQVFYREGKIGGKYKDHGWRIQMSARI
jgi:hypothetical protein